LFNFFLRKFIVPVEVVGSLLYHEIPKGIRNMESPASALGKSSGSVLLSQQAFPPLSLYEMHLS
jgi:hypothetical protein